MRRRRFEPGRVAMRVLLVLTAGLAAQPARAVVSIAEGSALYTSKGCSGSTCHTASPNAFARSASNSVSNLDNAITNVTQMKNLDALKNLTADERFSLALYLGSFKKPVLASSAVTINTLPGQPGSTDAHDLLSTDGSSGVYPARYSDRSLPSLATISWYSASLPSL